MHYRDPKSSTLYWTKKIRNSKDLQQFQEAEDHPLIFPTPESDRRFEPHSGLEDSKILKLTTHESRVGPMNVTDKDAAYGYMMDSSYDSTRGYTDDDSISLDKFFGRPIKIRTFEWGTGLSFFQSFNPWTDYFENDRVANRMNNYKLVRAKLHVKIVINGNAFQYGRLMASYLPLYIADDTTVTNSTVQTAIRASQCPHIFLNPTQSMGGELLLPFFWPQNNVEVDDDYFFSMGRMYIQEINPLKHANGATDQATISVFAWAEDVVTGGLTTNPIFSLDPQALLNEEDRILAKKANLLGLTTEEYVGRKARRRLMPDDESDSEPSVESPTTPLPPSKKKKKKKGKNEPQSGSEIDIVNQSGVISKPASSIAKLASNFKAVPTLAPYALATEIGARAIARIAGIFGYCRPSITKEPEPLLVRTTGSMALTNTADSAQKLSVDHKQELTVDPRIAGMGTDDPLSIRNIAGRESYLTSFTWAQGVSPDTLLWNVRVDPTVHDSILTIPSNQIYLPATAVAALPFRYWTGTLNYRFQVVCSAYHKGRLRIAYDPSHFDSDFALAEYNINYTHIVDIAGTTDFTVSVANGQATTAIQHFRPGINAVSEYFSTSRYTFSAINNGVLAVTVLNELTTPNSTVNNDIQINVFISAGDDFEVFEPCDDFMNYKFALTEPQSGEEISPEAELDQQVNIPVSTQSVSLTTPEVEPDDKLNRVFFGETISSFRQLLKRYNIHSAFALVDGVPEVINVQRGNFPIYRGEVAGAYYTAQGVPNFAYNFVNTVFLHWATMPFSGWRGSIRWKIIPRDNELGANVPKPRIEVERFSAPFTSPFSYSVGFTGAPGIAYTTQDQATASVMASTVAVNSREPGKPVLGANGMAISGVHVNPTLEYELPYYNNERFEPAKVQEQTQFRRGHTLRIHTYGANTSTLDNYVAAGEDFQVYFWTGMPAVVYQALPPNPI